MFLNFLMVSNNSPNGDHKFTFEVYFIIFIALNETSWNKSGMNT